MFVTGQQSSKLGSVPQKSVGQFALILIGIVVSLRPAVTELISAYSPQHLCTVQSLGLVGLTGVVACPFFWVVITFLNQQIWYTGGSNSNVNVRTCSPRVAGHTTDLPKQV